jgi:hypothetical protein
MTRSLHHLIMNTANGPSQREQGDLAILWPPAVAHFVATFEPTMGVTPGAFQAAVLG